MLRTCRYTEKEDNLIRDLYGRVRVSEIAPKLNRSQKSVEKRAVRLGLQSKGGPLYTGNPNSNRPTGEDHHAYRKEGEVWEAAGRMFIKVNGQIESYSRQVWEKAHGAIPSDKVVWHIDGDQTNCEIQNLELISLAERLKRNKENAGIDYSYMSCVQKMKRHNTSWAEALAKGWY